MKLPPLDSTATDKETLNFLAGLLQYTQPKLIVEAGTWKGHFSVKAAEMLPKCRVFTSDTANHFPDWEKLPDNLFFFKTDFEEMLSICVGDKFDFIDFAFIDSGPPFVQDFEAGIRLRHYEAVKPYMNKGGLIVSHDMNKTDWHGADKIIQEADLRLTGGRGITIWQKP